MSLLMHTWDTCFWYQSPHMMNINYWDSRRYLDTHVLKHILLIKLRQSIRTWTWTHAGSISYIPTMLWPIVEYLQGTGSIIQLYLNRIDNAHAANNPCVFTALRDHLKWLFVRLQIFWWCVHGNKYVVWIALKIRCPLNITNAES